MPLTVLPRTCPGCTTLCCLRPRPEHGATTRDEAEARVGLAVCRERLVLLSDYRGLTRATEMAAVHDAARRTALLLGWEGPYVADVTGVPVRPTFLAYAAMASRRELGPSCYVSAGSANAREAARAGTTEVVRPTFLTRRAALLWAAARAAPRASPATASSPPSATP